MENERRLRPEIFPSALRHKKAAPDFPQPPIQSRSESEIGGKNYDCNSLPGLNRMVLPSGMATCVPVRGLRPMPRLRGLTTKTPNPRSSIRSPRFIASFIASKRASTATSAFIFGTPVFSATLLMMSSLITNPPVQKTSIRFCFCLYFMKFEESRANYRNGLHGCQARKGLRIADLRRLLQSAIRNQGMF